MDKRGQASVEWVGAVLLIAAVMATVVLLALPGDGIAGAFVRQFHRALCIVGGGVCDLDRRPCPVQSTSTHDDAHMNFGILRVGHDQLMLYERQSDGTVLVTHLGDWSAGVEVGVGADGTFKVKGVSLSASAAARLAALGQVGGGDTWRFPDVASAQAGMSALSDGDDPAGGERVEHVFRIGERVDIDAQASLQSLKAAAGIDASLVGAMAQDSRDGSQTILLDRSASAGLLLRGGSSVTGTGRAAGDERIAIRFDTDWKPLELSIVRTGQLEAAYSLPDVVQGVADDVTGGSQRGRSYVVEQRLDLTDPESWRVTKGSLLALISATHLGRDTDALRERVEAAGVTEVRTYGLQTADNGLGGHIAVGVKFGGGVSKTVQEQELLDARVRGPDGLWRTRDDCLVAV